MEKKKVELLAPAGDFSCFMAAVNAGADAVYLGGTKFGARAYANNFTDGEIIEALKIAHLFDKKNISYSKYACETEGTKRGSPLY